LEEKIESKTCQKLEKLELVDAQFAYDLAVFGKSQSSSQIQAGILAFGSGGVIGFLFAIFDQNMLLFDLSIFLFLLSIAYTTNLTMSLVKTFSLHDYDQIWRDFNKTFFWCKSWAPFSHIQLRLVTIVQNETLINQGRYAELEAITRVQWAHDERDSVYCGVPKKTEVAYILAISLMGQRRFNEAIDILENLSKGTKKHYLHRGILHSLAFCYIERGDIEKANKLLDNNEEIMNTRPAWGLALDQDLVRVQLELHRKNLDTAAEKLAALSIYSRNSKISPEFRAHYFRTISRLRESQDRIEEAELHLQTAIDIIRSAPSLNSLSLSETYFEYSKFLERNGKFDQSLCMARQSEDFESDYLQKQLARLDDIRRLIARKSRYPVSMIRLLCESA